MFVETRDTKERTPPEKAQVTIITASYNTFFLSLSTYTAKTTAPLYIYLPPTCAHHPFSPKKSLVGISARCRMTNGPEHGKHVARAARAPGDLDV